MRDDSERYQSETPAQSVLCYHWKLKSEKSEMPSCASPSVHTANRREGGFGNLSRILRTIWSALPSSGGVGPVSVLPSLQPLIKGANVVPWPALLGPSAASPPKLKGGGAIDEADVNGDGDEVEALFGGGEFKQPEQVDTKRSRARRRAKRKKRVQALSFHFKFPLQRLLAHGICQFHGLTSKSVGDGNCRVFRVVKLKKASRRDNPQ